MRFNVTKRHWDFSQCEEIEEGATSITIPKGHVGNLYLKIGKRNVLPFKNIKIMYSFQVAFENCEGFAELICVGLSNGNVKQTFRSHIEKPIHAFFYPDIDEIKIGISYDETFQGRLRAVITDLFDDERTNAVYHITKPRFQLVATHDELSSYVNEANEIVSERFVTIPDYGKRSYMSFVEDNFKTLRNERIPKINRFVSEGTFLKPLLYSYDATRKKVYIEKARFFVHAMAKDATNITQEERAERLINLVTYIVRDETLSFEEFSEIYEFIKKEFRELLLLITNDMTVYYALLLFITTFDVLEETRVTLKMIRTRIVSFLSEMKSDFLISSAHPKDHLQFTIRLKALLSVLKETDTAVYDNLRIIYTRALEPLYFMTKSNGTLLPIGETQQQTKVVGTLVADDILYLEDIPKYKQFSNGLSIYKSKKESLHVSFISGVPYTDGKHNDDLSVLITSGGLDILDEIGATLDEDQSFEKSNYAHSTLVVDESVLPLHTDGTGITRFEESVEEESVSFIAENTRYEGVTHTRRVTIDTTEGKRIYIDDIVSSDKVHQYELFYRFSKKLELVKRDNMIRLMHKKNVIGTVYIESSMNNARIQVRSDSFFGREDYNEQEFIHYDVFSDKISIRLIIELAI